MSFGFEYWKENGNQRANPVLLVNVTAKYMKHDYLDAR